MLERLCSSSCAPSVHTPAQQTCRNPLESPKRYRATACTHAAAAACAAARVLCGAVRDLRRFLRQRGARCLAGACVLHVVRHAQDVASCTTLHCALCCIVHSVACTDCARVIGSGEAEEEAGNELAEQNM